VVEPVTPVARLDEDSREHVLEHVDDLRLVELRVGRRATPPPEGPRVHERPAVHLVEAAGSNLTSRGVTRVCTEEPLEGESLTPAEIEDALAAVPRAGKDHPVTLGHAKVSVDVEECLDVERPPPQGLRARGGGGGSAEHRERDEGQEHTHHGDLHHPTPLHGAAGVPIALELAGVAG